MTDDDISTSGGAVGLAARSSSGGSVRVAKGGPWEQAFTSESFTMSLWLKIDRTADQAAGHYPYFIQWASGKGLLGDGFWFGGVWSEPARQDDGAAIWHGGNRDDEVRTGASKLNDADWPTGSSYGGKWLHYTLTCKNENGIAHTVNYIDGRKVNEIDITITNGKSTLFTAPSAASDLCLVNGSDMKSVVTLIDEFRLSNGVRSPAEVAADYQAMVKVDFATFGRIRIASAPNPGLALIIK